MFPIRQCIKIGIKPIQINPVITKSIIIPSIISSRSIFQQQQQKPLLHFKFYSIKTTPPAPPPPAHHDKDYKGKLILNRISRATTFSLSTVLVTFASIVAVLVVYLIISELFFPSGDTRTFNKAVKLVEKNEQAQKVLNFNNGERLKAYGMVAADKWVRNRPVQSTKTKNKQGKDILIMKFQVESDKGKYGVVTLEQIDNSFWNTEFTYIALDVPGDRTIYIVEPERSELMPKLGRGTGFLGLNWGPKKD
ncbi:unnamed protein product [Candida verbasci]|uniref:Mitochondrial import inner membrane translocase subunit Tim21 n=1 Tax=Candida verbasci TaxID=1227364 RepID=A0A9W4XB06_9ASCO|nr:unnamed protein product [Candida verbasci]